GARTTRTANRPSRARARSWRRSWPACPRTSRPRSSAVPPRGSTASTPRGSRRRRAVLEEPTSLRIDDPGVRALFTEPARFQSWLDVEAALARAQAELGIIPEAAAREIVRKAHLSYLDLGAVREGLARTGHPLVPLVWELDHACEGDAG